MVFFCSTPLHPPIGVEYGAKQIGKELRIKYMLCSKRV